MQVQIYDKSRHIEQVCSWLDGRGLKLPLHWLPPTGLIIEGVCVSFLYLTNSPIAYSEQTLCNILIPKETRNQALDLLGTAMWDYARSLGVQQLQATTTLDAIASRAAAHGWKTSSVTLLIKEL